MTELPIIWRAVHFSLPLEVDQASSFLRQLATMAGAPRLVLEADGQRGQISWRIGGTRAALAAVANLIDVSLPGSALSTALPERRPVSGAVRLVLRGHRDRLVAVERSAATARDILAALNRATGAEQLRLQIVLGQRLHPSRPVVTTAAQPGQAEQRRLLAQRSREHGFGCVIRVGVSAASPARVHALLGGTLAAFAGSEAPGQRVRLARTPVRSLNRAASPWRWPLRLSVVDLAGFVGWPVGDLPLPGVGAAHPKPIRASSAVAETGRVVGANQVAGAFRPMALSVADSLRHTHLLGPTGTGKSTLIARLALQDMAADRSVVVIDPKGDLVRDLLVRIPDHRRDDVVVLDATDDAPVGINPLVGPQAELAADGLVSVFRDLYADAWGPRTQDILHASLLTLAKRGDASLVLVPLLLTNPGFRRSVVGRVIKADPMGLGSFWAWYESISDAERSTVIAPLMNKLRPVLLRPGLRAMLGQTQPRFDLREVFAPGADRRIVLVNLAKGDLGSDSARLLGSVVVALLWQRALQRSQTPASRRHPVMLFIDEVQDYLRLPGDLGDALAQARGLGVGFTLAHQHLGQLPSALRAAVLANTRSRICFKLSHEDASVIARGTQLDAMDFTSLPAFQAYASLLSDNSPTPYASLATVPLQPATSRAGDVRRISRERYGRPLSEVEAAWADLAGAAGRPEQPSGTGRERIGRVPRGGTS